MSKHEKRQPATGTAQAARPQSLDLLIPISFFASTQDTGKFGFHGNLNRRLTWGEVGFLLEDASRNRTFATKEEAPLFGNTVYAGTRARCNATECGMLVVDSDGGLPIREVVDLFQGDELEAILYTSARADPNGDRWRLLVPLRGIVEPAVANEAIHALKEYVSASLGKKVGDAHGEWDVDTGKLNCHSIFYVPAQYASASSNQFYHVSGAVLGAQDWLAAYPQAEPHVTSTPYRASYEDHDDLTLRKAKAALEVIPADIRHEKGWRAIGMILKDLFGGEGFELWDSWSRGASNYDPKIMHTKWDSFRGGGLGVGTLFMLADQNDPAWREQFRTHDVWDEKSSFEGVMSLDEMLRDWEGERSPEDLAAQAAMESEAGDPPRGDDAPHGGNAGANAGATDNDAPTDGKKTGTRRRKFSTAQEDAMAAPLKYVVEGLIPVKGDTAIYGPPQSLKSFLSVDIAASIAMGTMALGSFVVNDPGPVFYFAGEGYGAMRKQRRLAWEASHGMAPFGADRIMFGDGPLVTSDARLVEQDIQEIEGILAERGERARLTVIDTLNRSLNGQDEDKSSVASNYLNSLKRLRERVGGATLTIAHMGWDAQRERGSSAFHAGFDTILWIDKIQRDDEGCHTISLLVRKQKDGTDGQRYYFRSRLVGTIAGPSLVLEPITKQDGQADLDEGQQKTKTTPQEFERAYREIRPNGGRVGMGEISKRIALNTNQDPGTVTRYLQRKRGPGGRFHRYVAGDAQWALPGQHLEGEEPESYADRIKSVMEENAKSTSTSPPNGETIWN